MGTPGYRSPELLTGDPTFSNKSDIWGLGCIIFELVTGVALFESDYTVFEYAHARDPKGLLARFQDAIVQYLTGFTLLDADREWIVARLVSTISIEQTDRPPASELKGAFFTLLALIPSNQGR